uniref:Transcription factor domain-containing protein n=2 Tax=Kalmanozyma brasiliensis (strain GHG001) TaxID=1365824 RepID=V5EB01_KALBG
MHSHLQEEPAVKVSTPAVRRPLIESVIIANLFDEDEVTELVHFYYERLNPIIALLDSQIYNLKSLKTNPDYRILLAAICTVASKFIKVDRYLDSLEFLKPALSRIAADDIPPQLEIIQSLSILAMWKHPKDGSSWRKVRLAITQAFELGLHELFGPQKRSKGGPSRSYIQSQRTLFQLSCFEDGYRDQRHLPPAIDPSLLPDPREWIDSLGDMVQDIDVRLAASRENANIKRDLITSLKHSNAKSPNPSQISRATCLRNARLIKMAITAQTCSSSVWMNPPASEIPCQHSGRPCLLFHDTNTLFNYYRALYSIYSSPLLSGPSFADDRQAAFQKCSELSVQLFELLNGAYGQAGYYRYVHDIVILNLAVSAVWICDNWRAMPQELAMQACAAIRQAADATSPSLEDYLEQGSYLARFLRFCCKKLPSTMSINENSPVNAEDLVISEDAKWAMGLNPFTQLPNAFGSVPIASGSSFRPPYLPSASPNNSNGSGMQVPNYGGQYRTGNGNGAQHGLYHNHGSTGSQASGSPSLLSTSSPQGHHGSMAASGNDPSLLFNNGHNHGHGHNHSHSHGQSHGRQSHHQSGGGMNNSTVQYLSESLVPPAYPMNWDTYDDNSIITFLQSISSASA